MGHRPGVDSLEIKGLMMSFIDYPGNICVTIFTGRCNYRCPFCQNATLVLSPEKLETISLEKALAEIQKRKRLIDGITITGGEPLMNGDLPTLIEPVKKMGLLVKLDTNGAYPEELEVLIGKNLLDYVAMDIKSSQDKYSNACGVKVDLDAVNRSAKLLLSSKIDYEFRTTAVPGLVEKEDMEKIGQWLEGAKNYYLQQFIPGESLSEEYRRKDPHPPERLAEFAKIAERYFLNVGVRGL